MHDAAAAGVPAERISFTEAARILIAYNPVLRGPCTPACWLPWPSTPLHVAQVVTNLVW